MSVACQCKFAEKMDVAVKSGMPHTPHLIKWFSNYVKNCPESLGKIDEQIKDFFKVESSQLLFSEVVFHPNSSLTSNCLTSKLKFIGHYDNHFYWNVLVIKFFFEMSIRQKKFCKPRGFGGWSRIKNISMSLFQRAMTIVHKSSTYLHFWNLRISHSTYLDIQAFWLVE